MYNYKQILKQAFKIAWQNPGLWFFGFFVALAGGAGDLDFLLGSYNFSVGSLLLSFGQGLLAGGLFTFHSFQGLSSLLFSHPLFLFLAILILLLVIGFSILFIWLTIASQIALISQVAEIIRNRPIHWRGGFSVGTAKFWPVLGINVILQTIIGVLSIVLGYLSFFVFPTGVIIFIILFDILLVLALFCSLIGKYAICGIVLKDWRFIQSIKFSWDIFKKNWLLTFEIAVLLFTIYFIVNIVLFIILPFILFYFLRTFINFTFGFLLFLIVGIFLFVIVAVIITIFRWAGWVIVFELLTSKKTLLLSFFKRIYGH